MTAHGRPVTPGCWLIPITVKGINTLALIDTGASVTMMGRPLYQKVQQVLALKLQTHDMPRLKGVGGNPVPPLGHAEVEVWIAAGVYRKPVVVSARKGSPISLSGLISCPLTTVACRSGRNSLL